MQKINKRIIILIGAVLAVLFLTISILVSGLINLDNLSIADNNITDYSAVSFMENLSY